MLFNYPKAAGFALILTHGLLPFSALTLLSVLLIMEIDRLSYGQKSHRENVAYIFAKFCAPIRNISIFDVDKLVSL